MVDQSTNATSLWKKSGNQGNQWLQGSVVVTGSSFKLQFKATAGNGRLGDMALDDFQFSPKVMPSCRYSQYTCEESGKCITPNKVCDFISDCTLSTDEMRCGKFGFETFFHGLIDGLGTSLYNRVGRWTHIFLFKVRVILRNM